MKFIPDFSTGPLCPELEFQRDGRNSTTQKTIFDKRQLTYKAFRSNYILSLSS